MTVYIDADACPVSRLAVEIATKYKISCVLICDTSHAISMDGAETVIVSKGNDSTDFALVNKIIKGDVAITQDYGLACMCLGKGAYVINQNGLLYTNENIEYLMETRHEARKQRMRGKHHKGPKARTKENDDAFQRNFEDMLLRIVESY